MRFIPVGMSRSVVGSVAVNVGVLKKSWPWLAAVASGLFCTGCFAPFNQAWLCWIALIPLLAAIWFSGAEAKRRWLRDLLLGYVAGLAFVFTAFFWLQTVTVLGQVLVSAYMAIYIALWSCFCGRLLPNESDWLFSARNLRLAFFLASAWIAQEFFRSTIFGGWGWNTLGHALHAQWPLIQIVEFTGVPGLSFLVVFVNVILASSAYRLFLETKIRPRRAHFDFTLTMAAIVGVTTFGVHTVQTKRETKPLRVALVQANIAREEKFNAQFSQDIFEKFLRLSEPSVQMHPPVDLVVWPESSMPGLVLNPNDASHDFVTDFSAQTKIDLLLGTIEDNGKEFYNSAVLVSAAGKKTQVYRKVHLVPFGEYVPGRHTVPFISAIVGDQVPEDFSAGKEFSVFDLTTSGVRAAPLICFEDSIGELTRQFVLRGANLLVNITNDGWFERSAGSQQHLASAVFRCAETRTPLVRAANTGVTCFVNEFGRITNTLLDDTGSQFTDGVLTGVVSIPINQPPTFYVRHGEVFAEGCLAVTALVFLFLLARLVRRSAPNKRSRAGGKRRKANPKARRAPGRPTF